EVWYQLKMRRTQVFLIFGLPILAFVAVAAEAQRNVGELRLKETDPSGSGVKSSIELVCEANQFRQIYVTDSSGVATARRLAFGVYQIDVEQPGFAAFHEAVEIRSAVPEEFRISLSLASVNTSVTVKDTETLVDPHRTGSVNRIGSETLENRTTAQPGWLYEGNAVLHPRGSEYLTQFVVDGVPLTDNRSPSFGTEIEADDVQSMSIYTAGFPAEYGRKMGGVVEVNTLQDSQAGFHGQAILSGGSFNSAGIFLQGQYVWGRNTLGGSASGSMTDHYLNPVVPQNFSNTGTLGDFSGHYQRILGPNDRVSLIVRHEISRYDIPN